MIVPSGEPEAKTFPLGVKTKEVTSYFIADKFVPCHSMPAKLVSNSPVATSYKLIVDNFLTAIRIKILLDEVFAPNGLFGELGWNIYTMLVYQCPS